MLRWLIVAATVVARLGGGPTPAVTPKRVTAEKIGNAAKSDVAAEAPAPRRTRSFHISKKFIEDGVDDQRQLRAAATVAPTPITYEPTAAPHAPTPVPTYEPTYMPTYKPSKRDDAHRRNWGGRKHTGSWSGHSHNKGRHGGKVRKAHSKTPRPHSRPTPRPRPTKAPVPRPTTNPLGSFSYVYGTLEPSPGPVYSMAPTGPSPGSFSYVYDTPEPSSEPTAAPTQEPTAEPTFEPSPAPTSCIECSPSAECPPDFCCDYTIGPSGGRKLRFGSLEIGCCRAC